MKTAFALWITGLPSSGKSTLTDLVRQALLARDVPVLVLESDALRHVLTPHPDYSDAERDRFYAALVGLGALAVSQGLPVVFDATANRRVWRDRARGLIPRYLEVWVDTPAEVCAERDPKRLWRRAREGLVENLPGVGATYEAPTHAELYVGGVDDSPARAADRICAALEARGWLTP